MHTAVGESLNAFDPLQCGSQGFAGRCMIFVSHFPGHVVGREVYQ